MLFFFWGGETIFLAARLFLKCRIPLKKESERFPSDRAVDHIHRAFLHKGKGQIDQKESFSETFNERKGNFRPGMERQQLDMRGWGATQLGISIIYFSYLKENLIIKTVDI